VDTGGCGEATGYTQISNPSTHVEGFARNGPKPAPDDQGLLLVKGHPIASRKEMLHLFARLTHCHWSQISILICLQRQQVANILDEETAVFAVDFLYRRLGVWKAEAQNA